MKFHRLIPVLGPRVGDPWCNQLKVTLTEIGNTEKIRLEGKDDKFAFNYVEFEVQITEAIQWAFCITYVELRKKFKIGSINLGAGNVEIVFNPMEWMRSAKKRL